MPNYAYQAVDSTGKRTRGIAQAVSTGALTRTLEERGLLVLEVAESAEAEGGRKGFRFGRRREVLEVTRAMAALLPVGMPLAQALSAASGVASGDVRTALHEIRGRVERGETLSSALAQHRALFSPLYVGLVRAGEKSGDLDSAFARLSDQLERDEQLRGKVLSASIYPLLLAGAGSIAVTVLLFFVLPRFVTLKSDRVNSRIGPGLNYSVDWLYLKAGLPMEVIQEYDTWRRVRDSDGSEGWINQALLSGKRNGIVAPWQRGKETTINLLGEPDKQAGVVALVSAFATLDPGV